MDSKGGKIMEAILMLGVLFFCTACGSFYTIGLRRI